jgi:hypothetical protein
MKIAFLEPAKGELTEAISYYNTQSEGLGYEFAAEVKRTFERIAQYPDAWFKLVKSYSPLQDQQISLWGHLSS